MNITQKDRGALKSYFLTDAVPTEQQFAELIEGMVNQRDDGLVKQAGSPLSIEAAGDLASTKPVLSLYESFVDVDPAWVLRLNPRVDPADPATALRGLSIGDPSGASRLFIDHASGQVGIGTVEPQAALHVAGRAIIEEQEELREFEFQNGWSSEEDYLQDGQLHAPARYMKDSLGFVHFRGRLKAGVNPYGTVICTFDQGCWPNFRSVHTVFTWNANTSYGGNIHICPDGKVRCGNNIGSHIELGSISFQASPSVQ